MQLAIPEAALDNHIAILAKTGRGKTYTAKGIAEWLLEHPAERVCIIDPTGAWWGLKSSATGKSKGYPVVIFGGEHADMPLAATHGEALAEIIATSSTSVIIDTSQLRIGERTKLFTDLAETLLRKNKEPLWLIIDEAHLFAPKGVKMSPQSGQMLAAANELVSAGRGRGLRLILISQRPAKLHNDSLTQVETLIAMGMTSPADKKAILEWVEENASEELAADILKSLPGLERGTGWVWFPTGNYLELVRFPRIHTFDSSRTPERGEKTPTNVILAPIDRDEILERLKAVGVQAEANDPNALKRRIAGMEQELVRLGAVEKEFHDILAAPEPTKVEPRKDAEKRGFERGYPKGFRDGFKDAREKAEALVSSVVGEVLHKVGQVKDIVSFEEPIVSVNAKRVRLPITLPANLEVPAEPEPVPVSAVLRGTPGGATTATEQRTRGGIMPVRSFRAAIANIGTQAYLGHDATWQNISSKERLAVVLRRSPAGVTRRVWGVISGLADGGTLTNYIAEFTKGGLAENRNGRYFETDAGRGHEVRATPRITLEDLLQLWSRHGAKPSQILRLVAEAPQSRLDIARQVGLADGGTLTNYIAYGTSSGLIINMDRQYHIDPGVLGWLEGQPT